MNNAHDSELHVFLLCSTEFTGKNNCAVDEHLPEAGDTRPTATQHWAYNTVQRHSILFIKVQVWYNANYFPAWSCMIIMHIIMLVWSCVSRETWPYKRGTLKVVWGLKPIHRHSIFTRKHDQPNESTLVINCSHCHDCLTRDVMVC